jgi:hypothetical protein
LEQGKPIFYILFINFFIFRQQNPRVNDWFSWQAIPGNGRSGVPSMLSQLSMGAATHLSMFSQQSVSLYIKGLKD